MLFGEFFKVKCQVTLFPEDYKVLNLLYNPLVGSETIGLYQTLYFLSQSQTITVLKDYNHLLLFDLLNIREDYFLELKQKLEAVGLLQTYQNKKEIIYLLCAPLKYDDFLKDPLLGYFLLSEMGDKVYTLLANLFSKEDISVVDYHNVSVKFQDFYNTKRVNLQEDMIYQQHKKQLDQSFFDSDFNYTLFLESLSERFKKPILMEWKTIDFLKKLSFVYDLTPTFLAEIYMLTFSKYNDYNALDLNMLRIYLNKQNTQKYMNTKVVFYQKHHNDEAEMIIFLKKTSPQRIIQKYCHNNYRSSVSETVFQLVERNNVEKGIINALLIYILKLKEGILPTVAYLETVLKNWFKKGIVSTEDAYDFLIEDEKKIKKNKKHEKHTPNWLQNAQKELAFIDDNSKNENYKED